MARNKDPVILKDGPILRKLARKYVEKIGVRLKDYGAEVLGVQLTYSGVIFKVDATDFRTAIEDIRKETKDVD